MDEPESIKFWIRLPSAATFISPLKRGAGGVF